MHSVCRHAFKNRRMQAQTAARFEHILGHVTFTGAASRDRQPAVPYSHAWHSTTLDRTSPRPTPRGIQYTKR
jgi:hypothetical protein